MRQDAEILPLRELRKQQREGRNAVRSLFDDLDVTSEAELDQRLAELDHRMAHESNTVAEEKKMIAMIKKLEVRAPAVHSLLRSGGPLVTSQCNRCMPRSWRCGPCCVKPLCGSTCVAAEARRASPRDSRQRCHRQQSAPSATCSGGRLACKHTPGYIQEVCARVPSLGL